MSFTDSTNPLEWAEKFVEVAKTNPEIACDVDVMLSWFANAIMAGYDNARRKYEMVNAHETLMKHVLGESYVE